MKRHKVTRKTKSGKTVTFWRGDGSPAMPKSMKRDRGQTPSEADIERAIHRRDFYHNRAMEKRKSDEKEHAKKVVAQDRKSLAKSPRPTKPKAKSKARGIVDKLKKVAKKVVKSVIS